ncbi:MAG: tetratricopeptide repeat protein, partial [Cyanobacteria bacterium P01_A01_bin.68]
MLYRLKYLLATTALIYITLPTGVAFSQPEFTNVEKHDVPKQDSPARLQAIQLYRQGIEYYEQNQYQEALDKFQEALPILKQIGDKAGEVATLNYIGQIYINLKQYSNALKFLESASMISGDTSTSIDFRSGNITLDSSDGIGDTIPIVSTSFFNIQATNSSLGIGNNIVLTATDEIITSPQKLPLGIFNHAGIGNTLPKKSLTPNNSELRTSSQPSLIIIHPINTGPRGIGNTFPPASLRRINSVLPPPANWDGIGNTLPPTLPNNGELPPGAYSIGQGNHINRADQQPSIISPAGISNSLPPGMYSIGQGNHINRADQQPSIIKIINNFEPRGNNTFPQIISNDGELPPGAYSPVGRGNHLYPQNQQYLKPIKSIVNGTEHKNLDGVTKNNLGIAYLNQGKYDEAGKSINQALKFFRKTNDKTGQGNALNNLGELYRYRSQYPKALKYLNQGLEIFKDNKNQLGIGTAFNNIGLVHGELGQHSQALKHY